MRARRKTPKHQDDADPQIHPCQSPLEQVKARWDGLSYKPWAHLKNLSLFFAKRGVGGGVLPLLRWTPLARLLSLTSWRGARLTAILPLCIGWLSLSTLLTGCQPSLRPQDALESATVQQVISGNTLEVTRQANNQIQRVRLIGFDAPTPAQRPWGKAAMDFLRQVDKQAIQLEFDQEDRDSYDRLLAYVWHNGKLLNLAMVAEGYALMDSYLPNIRYEHELRRGQESARLQGLGIWDPANPMRQTPDEFREQRPR